MKGRTSKRLAGVFVPGSVHVLLGVLMFPEIVL